MQFLPVRGSPLLRSLFILLSLVATGFGLANLTGGRQSTAPTITDRPAVSRSSLPTPYRLTLSAAGDIVLDPGNLASTTGDITLDPANPHVILTVRWKEKPQPGFRHFAKLTLEPPGRPTVTHVFEAAGDIDELFELPLGTSSAE